METISPLEALQIGVVRAGGQSAFGRIFTPHRRQSTVNGWLSRSRQLPAEHVIEAEAATGVSRHLFRPDVYPTDAATLASVTAAVSCDRQTLLQERAA